MICPTSTQLRHWLAERLSDSENRAIEEHVERCVEGCQALLDDMSGFDDGPDASGYSWFNLPPLLEAVDLDGALFRRHD